MIVSDLRRIVVASPMKAGSTYVANVLAAYLDTVFPQVRYDWLTEQNLSGDLLDQLRGRAFCMNLHMRPHAGNLRALGEEAIRVVCLWRNLADMVVSFDDHTRHFGAHNPIFYIDHESFARLPDQQRYAHLIDGLTLWNLGFYLSWRRLRDLPFFPYEQMVLDPFAFMRSIIFQTGIALDDEKLRAVFDGPIADSRFNVGIVDRAANLLSEANKRRIEQAIFDHPEVEQLEVLLWELPWPSLLLERHSTLDGTTVRMNPDATTYFISSGRRHAVSPAWIASRRNDTLRAPAPIDIGELLKIPEGAPLF